MKRHIFNSNFTCVRTITIIAAAATLTVSCGIYKKYEREENVVSDSLFGEEYRTADTCALPIWAGGNCLPIPFWTH